jgi:GntR family transcriptional repressor for pyruvate dehydrogenase complex
MTSLKFAAPPVSLVENAMARIRDYIRDNDLKVGATLPGERHFAVEMGVSRAVMREAFGALAALHQIDVANGRRAKVAAIDASVMASSIDHAVATSQVSVADVWDVRRALELRTVALAAQNCTRAQAAEILAAAEDMVAAAHDFSRLSHADIALHRAIASASGNPLFLQIVRSFEGLLEVAVPRAWDTRETEQQRQEMLARHLEIAKAVATHDVGAAVAAMDAHFDASIGDLIRTAENV